MKPEAADASINDVLTEVRALNGRFDGLEGRFDGLEGRFDGLEGRIDGEILTEIRNLNGRFDSTDARFDELGEVFQDFATHVDQAMVSKDEFRSEMGRMDVKLNDLSSKMDKVETRVVTKDYLDRKLATHHSDLVLRMQKEDKKTLEMARGK